LTTKFAIDVTNKICYSSNKHFTFTDPELRISKFICNVVLAAR